VRIFLRLFTILLLLGGVLSLARQTFANICCGTYSCTKYDANGNVLDDYLSTCGGAACSGSGGGGCNAGYDMDDSGCEWKAGSSCGSTGSTPTPSSFMAGTMVSTPLGGKKIEDLKVGDRVISFTGNTIVESIVSKTHKVRRDYYFDLVADGYRVKVTAKHPFYIGSDEFKTAEELKAGDNVYVLENKSLVKKRVTSKTRVEKKADVYNLTVDGTNTYFAGGFAVHNKGGTIKKGNHDYSNCDASGGWACNEGTPNVTFHVQLYAGPVGGLPQTFLGEVPAYQLREDVGSVCGGNLYHGFTFPDPTVCTNCTDYQTQIDNYNSLKDGVAHNITAYVVKPNTASVKLVSSPKTITCAAPTATPPPTPTPTNTPTPTPIPAPVLTCTAYTNTNPISIIWNWTVNGVLTYWLRVWDSAVYIVDQWYSGPTVTTSAVPGVTYWGKVLSGDGTQSSPWSTTVSCTVPALSTPTGVCGTFNGNPTNPATPITYTWANGTALQVWDSTGKWWYNAAASSGIIISKDDNNLGSTFAVPLGRTVYARTTYTPSFNYFSTASETICPPPANPLPVTISGPLQQKSGTGCNQANATNNFNVQNPTTTTNPSSCVATACTVSPSTSAAQTYTCTTTFSSNNCLDDDPPTWPTSATINLTGVAPLGYSFIGWTPSGSCTPATNSKVVNAGDTIANQPITFGFDSDWIKLKNSSFNGVSITGVTVPAFVTGYDADDDVSKYFIIGNAGAVLKTAVSPNTAYSTPNWYDSSFTTSFSMYPSTFLNYVKSRKQHTVITNPDLSTITSPGIYIYNGALTLTSSNVMTSNVVLIVAGDVSISGSEFNINADCINTALSKNIAILSTGKISFSNTTKCAAGIFIAKTVDTGSNGNQGLKIKGNLIAQTTLTNNRAWSDNSRPSVFVVFDPVQYINLLPYLSTAYYDWRQIQDCLFIPPILSKI